ncbi:Protein of unknown function DUF2182, transmembrane, metal-binding protein [Gemmatirosa kalamazoonensis]|uniref:DUF2182 domain-containing protein n=1 Tax=Gemmatirosa kalamazoonensis TaxID=861299 RepID=W0RBG3_9BACT|nr:DUF2182 domain-containing protein [Gemmatirosa kalamazoonensis]AHG88141.1 Protein of unknown function DUF2182, transmembrane, metal-binding protein [Gemmatirosa kalamazoonensis]
MTPMPMPAHAMAAMMAAMMLPSSMLMLWRHHRAGGRLTAVVGIGYFAAWSALGAATVPLGIATTAMARAVPTMVGVVVAIAGALQLTRWKTRRLACCRHHDARPRHFGAALRLGVRLGLQCAGCCANLMAVVLVLGVADVRAMAVASVVIAAERLGTAGERVARVTGAVLVGLGLIVIRP